MAVIIKSGDGRKQKLYRPNDPSLLNRVEAAKYIGVSISSLAHWRALGRGPAYRVIGQSSYYSLADLDDWMASRSGRGEA